MIDRTPSPLNRVPSLFDAAQSGVSSIARPMMNRLPSGQSPQSVGEVKQGKTGSETFITRQLSDVSSASDRPRCVNFQLQTDNKENARPARFRVIRFRRASFRFTHSRNGSFLRPCFVRWGELEKNRNKNHARKQLISRC